MHQASGEEQLRWVHQASLRHGDWAAGSKHSGLRRKIKHERGHAQGRPRGCGSQRHLAAPGKAAQKSTQPGIRAEWGPMAALGSFMDGAQALPLNLLAPAFQLLE